MGVTVGVSQVLIIDEQPLTRLGLRVLLENESDFRVCGEAHDMVGRSSNCTPTLPMW